MWLERHLLRDFLLKLIDTNLWYSILCFSSWATLTTKFLSQTDTQTDYFQKQSNHVQDIPRKFSRNQYFLLFIQKEVKREESVRKNMKHVMWLLLCFKSHTYAYFCHPINSCVKLCKTEITIANFCFWKSFSKKYLSHWFSVLVCGAFSWIQIYCL